MNKAVTEKFEESLSDMLCETFDGSNGITFKKTE